jgi:hypothetical protein
MAIHWKEEYDLLKHQNKMWGHGCEVEENPNPALTHRWVYFATVCSFTFEFHSINQINACLKHYSQKIRSSTRIPEKDLWKYGGDHGETQCWFERLPQKLYEERRRKKVIKALERALSDFLK